MMEATSASKLGCKTDNPCIHVVCFITKSKGSTRLQFPDNFWLPQSCARHFNEHSFLAWNVFDVDTLVLQDTLHSLLPQLGSNTCTTLRWALSWQTAEECTVPFRSMWSISYEGWTIMSSNIFSQQATAMNHRNLVPISSAGHLVGLTNAWAIYTYIGNESLGLGCDADWCESSIHTL